MNGTWSLPLGDEEREAEFTAWLEEVERIAGETLSDPTFWWTWFKVGYGPALAWVAAKEAWHRISGKQAGTVLQRAQTALERTANLEVEQSEWLAEHSARVASGSYREWQLPEAEPPKRSCGLDTQPPPEPEPFPVRTWKAGDALPPVRMMRDVQEGHPVERGMASPLPREIDPWRPPRAPTADDADLDKAIADMEPLEAVVALCGQESGLIERRLRDQIALLSDQVDKLRASVGAHWLEIAALRKKVGTNDS
jgi:hypothetical protein